jgi:hypothetical protein
MVPATKIVAYSNDLVCPNCGRPLAISGFSRNLSAFTGLIAGAIVWRVASAHYSGDSSALGWVFPIVFAYLALSVVSPLVLMLTADLHLRSTEPASIAQEIAPAAQPHH